ncbi:CatA-like O-acetyltransferase [Sediminitomix flava]|nr:CatA-like O-acetyltransferase [Sediminitomix flava]
MTTSEILEKYEGKALTENDISSYEKWSLNFFHEPQIVREPYLQMTLQLDVTEALKVYKQKYAGHKEASFTAYLMWHLVQTQKAHPYFRYRKIEDKWYIFENLPVFAPIAVGGDKRFSDIVLENPLYLSCEDFFKAYREQIYLKKEGQDFSPIDEKVWQIAHFVGNLPNLQFTGFTLHMSAINSGRPYFYFGKRYVQEGKTQIPLLVSFDHANLDPFVLSAFIADFEQSIKS